MVKQFAFRSLTQPVLDRFQQIRNWYALASLISPMLHLITCHYRRKALIKLLISFKPDPANWIESAIAIQSSCWRINRLCHQGNLRGGGEKFVAAQWLQGASPTSFLAAKKSDPSSLSISVGQEMRPDVKDDSLMTLWWLPDLLVARQRSACVCVKLNFDSGSVWVTLLLSYPLHYSVVSSRELPFSAPFISSFLDFLPLLIRSGSDGFESEVSSSAAAASSRCVPKTLKCRKKKNFATDMLCLGLSCQESETCGLSQLRPTSVWKLPFMAINEQLAVASLYIVARYEYLDMSYLVEYSGSRIVL